MCKSTWAGMMAVLALALPARAIEVVAPPTNGMPESVHAAWAKAEYRFTPEVEAAYLDAAKAGALERLSASGVKLPSDFLAWIDSDPVVRTTVYGARQDPVGILRWLRSLEIDLGTDTVRKKYTQLALAMAVVRAKTGDQANLAPRDPLVLKIGGDPRVLVDTHATNRVLDLDDHIINFLNDHAPIEEEVVVGYKEVPPELKYDSKGKAIPVKAGKPKKEPLKEMRKRPLRAADVIASADLEKEFNAYLAAHGQKVTIHCGDTIRLNWNSHDAHGIDTKGSLAAYELFKHAYEAKGYLPPKGRDPAPSPAEKMAFLIRNNEYVMPTNSKAAWPKFPLTAPWPVLTMLAHDNQPLREMQDIWERYRDKGEFHGYGEYVGNIAQGPFLQVRRIAPYAFPYGSVQMMFKDGGVCGVMASIATRSHQSLGTPASTAGQPGHCALVLYGFNSKDGTYNCHGGQYATAGDAGTGVHYPWSFGDVDARRPMVYHQSVAWAVNYGFQSFLDAMAAHAFYKALPATDRSAHGEVLLTCAATSNPYAFLIVEDELGGETDPARLIGFWRQLKTALASGKSGCPANGLYNTTIQDKLFARLAAVTPPTDAAELAAVTNFLADEKCANQAVLTVYKRATEGLPSLLTGATAAFRAYLGTNRTLAAGTLMADAIVSTAAQISDRKERAAWALVLWQEIQGREKFLSTMGRRGSRVVITTDPSLHALARLVGRKPRPDVEQTQSLVPPLVGQMKAYVSAPREPSACNRMAAFITATAAGFAAYPEQRAAWLDGIAGVIAGHEQFEFKAKGKIVKQQDPCVDVIAELRKPAAPPST